MDTLFRGNVELLGLLSLVDPELLRPIGLGGRLWKNEVQVPGACFGSGTSTMGLGTNSLGGFCWSNEYFISGGAGGGGPEKPPWFWNC